MKDYRNMSCAACDVVFDEESDIVICPECGAPHHRECWKAEGHCACEKEHSEGYTWEPQRNVIGDSFKPDGEELKETSTDNPDGKITCPVCGNETLKSEKYCERCGYYLAHSREGAYSEDGRNPEFGGLFDFDESELIEGVPAGDVKKFVGGMWMYYIPRFIKLVRKKSMVSFNFTAFLTHGLWFISRKMYGIGLALVVIMMGISAYQVYFYSVFETMFGGAKMAGTLVYMCVSALQYVIMALCGLFGNKMYMRFCSKKIKQINAKATAQHATAEQFNEAIQDEGGIAMLQTFSIGFCYLAVLYILENGWFF